MSENAFLRPSVLRMKTRHDGQKTVVDEVYFTSPLKVLPPVYLPDQTAQIFVLAASAGILAGDVQEFSLRVGKDCRLELTGQSYEKIHPMPTGKASRHCEVVVEQNAFLFYNPLPVLPFADSAFESTMTFHLLDNSAKLILVDILACGRAARNERFAFRSYRSLVEIYTKGQLVFRDNACYFPQKMLLEKVGLFEGYSHFANMVVCNCNLAAEQLQAMREILQAESGIQSGISVLHSGDRVIKLLGSSGQQLTDVCQRMCAYIR
ncbi:urease accessory protein UreD [Sporomusa acidovorans]|uniref:Urease accessory protein UreD n=1 Tax=Sporomusa acidovorans (strain ATCC 49682 / DSM 3132 / Mol) TaxID=1123286 RepID=A0ABZ3J9T3_SPOA4|nr:urease accessory protein UreD [Sporomusa acidovorans]OZC16228.1 urease accessory protein UreH [Sporomusa acidovorans DSM 3132]SDE31965.1 urease accessory protein [Sporomusa acidovorans]